MIYHDASAAAAGDVGVGFDDECTLAVLTAQLQQLRDVSYGDTGDVSYNDAGDVSRNDADGCDGERSGYINGIAAAADDQSSGAVGKSRWLSVLTSLMVFRGRKATLNHASALVTVCP